VITQAAAVIISKHNEAQERARAEQALRESEALFRTFVMASWDVVYQMSPDWKEMRYLKGKDFLADTEEASSHWIETYLLDEDRPGVLAVVEEAIRTKRVFELEHRVIRADGTIGWTHSRAEQPAGHIQTDALVGIDLNHGLDVVSECIGTQPERDESELIGRPRQRDDRPGEPQYRHCPDSQDVVPGGT